VTEQTTDIDTSKFRLSLKSKPQETQPDLSTPSPLGLAWVLRHRDEWPRGFSWYYPNPASCGVGLATRLWPQAERGRVGSTSHVIAHVMGMEVNDAYSIFIQTHRSFPGTNFTDVTPEQVAELLEDYAADHTAYASEHGEETP
jgi:hypothetical protein